MDSNRQNKSGFSFADDLMVDITGALFPGLLFLTIFFVGIVGPIMIYDKSNLLRTEGGDGLGSVWWVALIIVLIISYVIGHLFFRSDILEPDKRDIRRIINEELNKWKKIYRKGITSEEVDKELRNQAFSFKNTLENFLRSEGNKIEPLENRDLISFYKELKESCEKIINSQNEYTEDYLSNLLAILFPEELQKKKRLSGCNCSKLSFSDLNPDIQKVMNKYKEDICFTLPQKLFRRLKKIIKKKKCFIPNEEVLNPIVCSCILNIQSDLGCISDENCNFPYLYYYKYLLRRNLSEYLDEVKWNADNTRSKNVINDYKIEIQLFAPAGYALVRKNEAHIRMSSSTWHMAQPLRLIMATMSLITFFAFILNCNCIDSISSNIFYRYGLGTTQYGSFVALLIPLGMYIFLRYAQNKISHFIHYQRMREIFYTISIYDDYRHIIEGRKKKDKRKSHHLIFP